MALLDIWDYIRASGDRRLRKQGYVSSGVGILERYRRAPGYWAPHLETNRKNILRIAERITPRGGTLLILGAGRLLDVPWEDLFPRFERVLLVDADYCIVPYVERLLAAAKIPVATPQFEIGDVTASVVDTAAWAEHTIERAGSPADAARALAEGFDQAGTPQPSWVNTYADVRMVISTNLLSQLGYFPRLHVQTEFRKRFDVPFEEQIHAAERLECYFDRVRARHVHSIAALKKSHAYLSTDIDAAGYELAGAKIDLAAPSSHAGVSLSASGQIEFQWPVKEISHSDPLHGQAVKNLWPGGTKLDSPQRWVWHIVPQGSEKKYMSRGRVHIVEGWAKNPG